MKHNCSQLGIMYLLFWTINNLVLLDYFFKNISYKIGEDWHKIGLRMKAVEEAMYRKIRH